MRSADLSPVPAVADRACGVGRAGTGVVLFRATFSGVRLVCGLAGFGAFVLPDGRRGGASDRGHVPRADRVPSAEGELHAGHCLAARPALLRVQHVPDQRRDADHPRPLHPARIPADDGKRKSARAHTGVRDTRREPRQYADAHRQPAKPVPLQSV